MPPLRASPPRFGQVEAAAGKHQRAMVGDSPPQHISPLFGLRAAVATATAGECRSAMAGDGQRPYFLHWNPGPPASLAIWGFSQFAGAPGT